MRIGALMSGETLCNLGGFTFIIWEGIVRMRSSRNPWLASLIIYSVIGSATMYYFFTYHSPLLLFLILYAFIVALIQASRLIISVLRRKVFLVKNIQDFISKHGSEIGGTISDACMLLSLPGWVAIFFISNCNNFELFPGKLRFSYDA